MARSVPQLVVLAFLVALTARADARSLPRGAEDAGCLGGFRPHQAWATRPVRPAALRTGLEPPGPVPVTGEMRAVVVCVKFANTTADPWPVSALQTRLFDGPGAPATLTEYYEEISYGAFRVTGDVHGWVQLPEDDTYYEAACNGVCRMDRMREIVVTALDAIDSAVDFGLYDNDGPDGVPDSGDDDGRIDAVVIVYPEKGPACGGDAAANLRPHMRSFSWYDLPPWESDDPAAGSGVILADEYTFQSGLNCAGDLEGIGEFAHELGHVLGLWDLYDPDGGSAGAGFWALMGTGRFMTVEGNLPGHMTAYSKQRLGWIDPVRVGTGPADVVALPVTRESAAFRMDVMHERWRRRSDCPGGDGIAMHVGLSAAEASARHWPGGPGYGNGWQERVHREFHYDGSGPVTLAYDYAADVEDGWDFVYVDLAIGDQSHRIRAYTGSSAGSESLDLSPWLAGLGAVDYSISFVLETDGGWSDEDFDGVNFLFEVGCSPFAFDNVAVVGGGEDYFTDFEIREDGWVCDMADPSEYFLAELRLREGADAALPGEGLLVWHVDEDVALSGLGMSGGTSELMPRGAFPVQADGLDDLLFRTNHGDEGDPFPGSSGNDLLDSATLPAARGYNGEPTNVSMEVLSVQADSYLLRVRGGWPAPSLHAVQPDSGQVGTITVLEVGGQGLVADGVCELRRDGATLPAESVEWVGKDLVRATFDLGGVAPGDYDLRYANPGEGSSQLSSAFVVHDRSTSTGGEPGTPRPLATRLGRNSPNPFNPATEIPFEVAETSVVTIDVYDLAGRRLRRLVRRDFEPGSYSTIWDGRDDDGHALASGVYVCRMEAGGRRDLEKMLMLR